MPPRPADLGATARDNIPRLLPRETRSACPLCARWLRLTRSQGCYLLGSCGWTRATGRLIDRSTGAAATPASDPSKARGSLSERTRKRWVSSGWRIGTRARARVPTPTPWRWQCQRRSIRIEQRNTRRRRTWCSSVAATSHYRIDRIQRPRGAEPAAGSIVCQ
ncbi:hypothetical protein PVAP13_5KG057674 [Panicum virgatum]|uniref:Uncharacterized protein n=1 Tax=Panicum virgatum TaxID=38727 RepID=A0A8T0S7U8_PANVG|nr:hypothetical protein PVAP13_5KG057674 [Panicum virgatum]